MCATFFLKLNVTVLDLTLFKVICLWKLMEVTPRKRAHFAIMNCVKGQTDWPWSLSRALWGGAVLRQCWCSWTLGKVQPEQTHVNQSVGNAHTSPSLPGHVCPARADGLPASTHRDGGVLLLLQRALLLHHAALHQGRPGSLRHCLPQTSRAGVDALKTESQERPQKPSLEYSSFIWDYILSNSCILT